VFRPAALGWLDHAVVKFWKSTGICRNLNRILWFYDAHGFIEIGFVRRIFADFAHPSDRILRNTTIADTLSLSIKDPGAKWEKVRQIETISEASNATSTSAARKKGPIFQGLITQAPLGTGCCFT
jgi:hypothetical protein